MSFLWFFDLTRLICLVPARQTNCGSIPDKGKIFLCFQSIPTGPGAQTAFYWMSNWDIFPGGTAAGAWDYSIASFETSEPNNHATQHNNPEDQYPRLWELLQFVTCRLGVWYLAGTDWCLHIQGSNKFLQKYTVNTSQRTVDSQPLDSIQLLNTTVLV
jgi:hypothetical protein